MKISKYLPGLSIFLSVLLLVIFYIRIIPIFYEAPKVYPNYVHKILYVDRTFSEEEVLDIKSAAQRWTDATNHIVEYDVIRLPISAKINMSDSIVITQVSPDFPYVMELDDFEEPNTTGYYYHTGTIPYIALVPNTIGHFGKFRSVLLHELGHSLGLAHTTGVDGIGTLMYPYMLLGSPDITQTDLENFCKLYHCDASKLSP